MDWVYWRLVRAGLARGLVEVTREWSLMVLVQAHEVLDVEADIEIMSTPDPEK